GRTRCLLLGRGLACRGFALFGLTAFGGLALGRHPGGFLLGGQAACGLGLGGLLLGLALLVGLGAGLGFGANARGFGFTALGHRGLGGADALADAWQRRRIGIGLLDQCHQALGLVELLARDGLLGGDDRVRHQVGQG